MIIRYATEADVPALADINVQSFRDQAFFQNTYPGLGSEAIHPVKRARCYDKLQHPQTHVLAAVDETSGQVVGYARWVIPQERGGAVAAAAAAQVKLSEEAAAEVVDGVQLPEEARREVYDYFFRMLKEKGKGVVREDDIVLELLATLPAAQGKGVGKALLNWGLERSRALQRRIYLEATTAGFPLYRKLGWETQAEVELDYRDCGGEGTQLMRLMVREADAL